MKAQPKLYSELADWWPLLSAPGDYAEEAAFYRRAIDEHAERSIRTVLELGSGGGNNASHLKRHFEMTLVDRASEMIEVSRRLNPDLVHIQGDMRTVRLDRTFDAVFIHDAIVYLTNAADLRLAVETALIHCKPGGVALFAPDWTRETFRATTEHGGHDGEERSLRYLAWTWDPDPDDSSYVTEFAYLLRERDETVCVEHDRHVCGLFAYDEWLAMIHGAAFRARAIPFEHSEVDLGQTSVFIGVKPT